MLSADDYGLLSCSPPVTAGLGLIDAGLLLLKPHGAASDDTGDAPGGRHGWQTGTAQQQPQKQQNHHCNQAASASPAAVVVGNCRPAASAPFLEQQPLASPSTPIMQLLGGLRAAFASERAAGVAVNNRQPQDAPESFARLDGAVRQLLGQYARAQDDWRQFAFFNEHVGAGGGWNGAEGQRVRWTASCVFAAAAVTTLTASSAPVDPTRAAP